MKGLVSFLLALAGTVFAMSVNLHAAAGGEAGAAGFLATLLALALWLACAVAAAENRRLCRAAICVLSFIALAGAVGAVITPKALDNPTVLPVLLMKTLFAGFEAIGARGPGEVMALGVAACVFIALFHAAMRKKYMLRQDEDLLALEHEQIVPSIDPELAPALESRAKKLLGLRDPAERLSGKS